MNSFPTISRWLLVAACAISASFAPCSSAVTAADPIRVLIIDGQNNHQWKVTTPLIRQTLEACGRFTVDVATTPEKGDEFATFSPNFSDYGVVVSNYNGQPWPESTQQAFEKYVAGGGGFVSVHAADNSFPEWAAYNRMIGVGGWGGRSEKDGPYVRWRNGQIVRDLQKGNGGSHGKRHPFVVVVRDADHPITAGLPSSFIQAEDELYAELRGPAENMHVLATAMSDTSTGGTGEHEPILMTVQFGNGRAFHTTLGHDVTAMKGVAFQATLQRGTEWAATGTVTLPAVDASTLSSDEASLRDPATLGANAALVDPNEMPSLKTGGWVPLFNGENLNGWQQKNGTASYSAEDQTIVGRTAVGSVNSFLCTERDYQNFELTFEVNVQTGLNSGVQIRSKSLPEYKSGRVHGPQIEIEALDSDGNGDAGYIYSEGTDRNWLSTQRPIQNAYLNDQWNRYCIRAVGPRLQVWLNGQKIEDLSDDQSPAAGFIGLQVHSIGKDEGPFEVRWRDIQIRPLAAEVQVQ
jgi:type 1 glutamine amidotransferase